MSEMALATSRCPLAPSVARAAHFCDEASHMPVATPQPISSPPSRIDRGAGDRFDQPNASAPWA